MRYHRGLMQMILHDKAQIAKAVNAGIIVDDAQASLDFDLRVVQEVMLNAMA